MNFACLVLLSIIVLFCYHIAPIKDAGVPASLGASRAECGSEPPVPRWHAAGSLRGTPSHPIYPNGSNPGDPAGWSMTGGPWGAPGTTVIGPQKARPWEPFRALAHARRVRRTHLSMSSPRTGLVRSRQPSRLVLGASPASVIPAHARGPLRHACRAARVRSLAAFGLGGVPLLALAGVAHAAGAGRIERSNQLGSSIRPGPTMVRGQHTRGRLCQVASFPVAGR